jgi:hypothetical protein
MRGSPARSFLALGAVVLALAAVPAAAAATHPVQDPIPIGPNEYFTGLINNHPPGNAIIEVTCTVGAKTGHPVAGQPVEVETTLSTATSDLGYTGSAGTSIVASLSSTTSVIVFADFTSFYVKTDIPTDITVPCSGTGTAAFTPSPGSSTAITATLPITFANITTG